MTRTGTAAPLANGRWLVVGAKGMLGTEVVAQLDGRDVSAVDLPEVDITDAGSAADFVSGHDVVVNCAAWTAVDDAESNEGTAFRVNATGVANLAAAASRAGAWCVQISTDYVFAGTPGPPVPEDALPDPRSAYGRTKAAGEWAVRAALPTAHYLLRTAWLYGANGPNFARTMAKLAQSRETIDVVDDQLGQPTWARDLAKRIVAAVDAGIPAGTYHATSSGQTSWYGFAREVFRRAGLDPERIRPTGTDKFPRPAPRPAWSVLGHERWRAVGMEPLPDWEDALGRAVAAGLLRDLEG